MWIKESMTFGIEGIRMVDGLEPIIRFQMNARIIIIIIAFIIWVVLEILFLFMPKTTTSFRE